MPGSDLPLTKTIADWVSSTGTSDLPPEVSHQVRRIVVDYLTATLLGATTEPATIVREYYASHDTSRASTVIGTTVRLSPPNAAAANGTAAHALDLDDGYTPGGFHPAASVVSAALSAAEDIGNSAEDIVRAIALGYEVACRLAGSTHPHQRNRGFHNTALVGVFGAATAVGVLRDLDALRLANAYGLAGSHAGGLNAYLDEGSDVKRYHPGKAARDGLVSAELAARGLTAPTTVLEGPRGYLHAFAGGQFDLDHLVGDLGNTWRMTRTYNKPYPCCRHVHGAIDAALDIREREGLSADDIESVRVETFAIAAHHDNKDIHHVLDAQMSLPYSVSVALVHGEVGMEQFGDRRPGRQPGAEDHRRHRSHDRRRPHQRLPAQTPGQGVHPGQRPGVRGRGATALRRARQPDDGRRPRRQVPATHRTGGRRGASGSDRTGGVGTRRPGSVVRRSRRYRPDTRQLTHTAVMPPSTTNALPFTNVASSLTR
jgi:2-methylcitrate dehydratase PrpD